MRGWRGIWLVALLLVAAPVTLAGCGCGDFDTGASDVEPVRFTGELGAKEGTELVFVLDDGSSIDVVTEGRTWPLDPGDRYRVVALPDGRGVLRAGMPGSCGSGLITHADGSQIETSYFAWAEQQLWAFVVYGGLGLLGVVALWAGWRVITRGGEGWW